MNVILKHSTAILVFAHSAQEELKHIKDYNEDLLNDRKIIISQHCYGCTAGAGSSRQRTVI